MTACPCCHRFRREIVGALGSAQASYLVIDRAGTLVALRSDLAEAEAVRHVLEAFGPVGFAGSRSEPLGASGAPDVGVAGLRGQEPSHSTESGDSGVTTRLEDL